jgi:PAS domain S-box-containing protein
MDAVNETSCGAAEHSWELFRTFVRRSRDGIIIIDANGTVIEWNEGQEAISGIPRAEALSRPMWELQYRLAPAERRTPEYLRLARHKILQGLKQGVQLKRDLLDEIERADGTRRVVESILFGFRNNGQVLAAGICRDVTENKRLEEGLRERQALLMEAERLVHLGYWHLDLRTGRSSWSDEAYRVLGHEPGAFIPTRERFLDAVVAEDRERIAGALHASARDGEVRRNEFRILTAQGTIRSIVGTVELLRDARGAPAMLIGTVQDITERKAMELALEEASRRKDDFLAVLSHELRNPLAPMRSSLYVLARAEPAGEQARRVQAILERQVTHLARLVDDLLDVSRVSRGRLQLKPERMELGALVRRSLEDHGAAITAAGITLQAGLSTTPMWLHADPTRIAQVVGNLLGNASKFTPRGGRVQVTLEAQGDQARLQVRDSGVGISREMLGRVFEPFTQAQGTLDRSPGGLGLGLSLVKALVELHGGSVDAYSAGPASGAVFTLLLPLDFSTAPVAEPVRRPPAEPRRVLIIEDNVDAANGLQEVLQLGGHDVRVAYNGSDGLAEARTFRPQVVFCDLGLPGMDGYEVARTLRAAPEVQTAYVVALSGYALPEDVQRALEAGFDRHLAKPPSMEQLNDALRGESAHRP